MFVDEPRRRRRGGLYGLVEDSNLLLILLVSRGFKLLRENLCVFLVKPPHSGVCVARSRYYGDAAIEIPFVDIALP